MRRRAYGTYHRVRLSGAGLAVGEKATVVAFPSVVEDLLAEGLVHHVLVSILWACRHKDAIIIDSEPIMGPEGVIECEGALVSRIRVDQHRRRTILQNHNTSVNTNKSRASPRPPPPQRPAKAQTSPTSSSLISRQPLQNALRVRRWSKAQVVALSDI